MRKHFFTLMALAATLCACNKEQMIESETPTPGVTPQKVTVFTATMEGAPETRATYDGTYKCASWEVDDRISINGVLYQAQTAGTSTTFSESVVMEEMRPVYISSANTGSYGNQPAANLVDDAGTSTRWCVDNTQKVNDAWNIVVSTGKDTQLKSIKLWNADNTSSYPNRVWKKITVYGSMSATKGWEEINTFDNLNLAANNSELAGTIDVNATKPYTFYKIDVLDNEGDSYMQMADMKFVVEAVNWVRPRYVSSTNTQSYNNQNPASNLVDDAGTSTRWCVENAQKVNDAWNIVVTTDKTIYLKNILLWNAESGSGSYRNRIWKKITVYGSLSANEGWEEIKSFDDLNLTANNYGLAGTVAINATKAYSFYKIDVLDNKGDSYMQMSDMKFEAIDPSTFAPYDVYFPASLNNGTSAVLPANITETWADGKFNMPMYAHSESTNLQFKNLCGVLKVIVKNNRLSEVKGIRVSSANKATSGAFTVNSDNAAVLTSPTNTANSVTVTYTEAVPTTAEGTVFYVAIPAQTYRGLKIELSADGENFTKAITTKEDADIVVERNKIYPINHVKTIPSGALPFEFTVNAQGKKVYFSKGNLQATFLGGDPTNYSWGFAQHQYDIIGDAAGNTTIGNQTAGAVVDLFGWSTPSTYYGISTSENSVDYTGDFKDWGTAIDNIGTWRTLSKDEWSYLCETRAASTVNGIANVRYAYTTIFLGFSQDFFPILIQGIILFPDDYTHPSDVYPDFEDIELDDWLKMEAAGCVFLPREGYRSGSKVLGSEARYCSSSKEGANGAYYLNFSERGLECPWSTRNFCHSVRLVTDVK